MDRTRCSGCAGEGTRLRRAGSPADWTQLDSASSVAAFVGPMLDGLDREQCLLVAVDSRLRLLRVVTVSIGTTEHTFMAPREIYRDALLLGAHSIFVAHNHPSGDATPSVEDRQITRRLARAGQTLGVPLLDHLVTGAAGSWSSLAALGVL